MTDYAKQPKRSQTISELGAGNKDGYELDEYDPYELYGVELATVESNLIHYIINSDELDYEMDDKEGALVLDEISRIAVTGKAVDFFIEACLETGKSNSKIKPEVFDSLIDNACIPAYEFKKAGQAMDGQMDSDAAIGRAQSLLAEQFIKRPDIYQYSPNEAGHTIDLSGEAQELAAKNVRMILSGLHRQDPDQFQDHSANDAIIGRIVQNARKIAYGLPDPAKMYSHPDADDTPALPELET